MTTGCGYDDGLWWESWADAQTTNVPRDREAAK